MQSDFVADEPQNTSNFKTCLVTGGAGFIGSHLCDKLIAKGYRVVCLDNLITGSKKNIEHLVKDPNFKFIEDDVCNPGVLGSMTDFSDIDYIFHLASPASPIDYQNYPEETFLANSTGTLNMLKLAKEKDAKMLYASTSEVYGDPLEHPQKETYFGNVNTFGPRSCYDEGKRYGETASYIYIRKYDTDIRIVRIFNTYGPRMQKDDGRVVSNFINAALKNEPLRIDGDGSQTRSFCYVDDLVDGILLAMFNEKTKSEIINLGNPREFTVEELAKLIVQLTGSKSEIEYSGKFRENDPMRRRPNISKAKEILDWEPKINPEDGLIKTIEYYREN